MDDSTPSNADDRPPRCDGGDTSTRLIVDSIPWLRSLANRRRGVARLGLEEADDLVQEVCLEALAARQRSRPARGRAGAAWLRTIALRRLTDRVRYWNAQRREISRRVDLDGGVELTSDRDPVDLLQDAELRRRIDDAIDALPEVQREVLVAQWRRGLSTAEIATELGRSENAVRILRSRALAQVRARVGD